MFRALFCGIAVLVCTAAWIHASPFGALADSDATDTSSQGAEVTLSRGTSKSEGADASSSNLVLRVTSSRQDSASSPQIEVSTPPVEPVDPGSEEDDPHAPTFFGEPISGNTVFVIDISDSMRHRDVGGGEDYDGNVVTNMSRMEAVKYELVKMLLQLDEEVAFDIIWLAGIEGTSNNPAAESWTGSLSNATPDVVQQAVGSVKRVARRYGTPTWRALHRSTHDYGDDLSKIVLLSDGEPHPKGAGSWGANAHSDAILADFPGWYEPLASKGCKLVCVLVGRHPGADAFMQSFASTNNADFIRK